MRGRKRFNVAGIISAVMLVAVIVGIIGVSGFMLKSDTYNDYDIAKVISSIDTKIKVEIMEKSQNVDMKEILKEYNNAVMLRVKSGNMFPFYLEPSKVLVDKYDNTILLYLDGETFKSDYENLTNDGRIEFAKNIEMGDIVLGDTKITVDSGKEAMSYASEMMNTREKSEELLREGVNRKVRIGVIDTGLYSSNSEVIKYFNLSESFDYVNQDNDTIDGIDSHATQVASVMIDVIGEDLAENNIELINAKILENGTGSSINIFYAVLDLIGKVDIINLSCGLLGESDPMIEFAIKEADRNGVIVVCSAGNESTDTSGNIKHIPSGCEKAISVSAIDAGSNFAYFSNYGDVDFAAPGVEMLVDSVEWSEEYVNGTSFSAPCITGAIAIAKLDDKSVTDKESAVSYLKGICNDLGATGWDKFYGYGVPVFDVKDLEEPTTEKPTKPVERPTEEPTTSPVERPTEEPTTKPVERPTEEPATSPVERPTEEPTTSPVERPTEEPTTKPVEKPTEEPTTEEPTEIPTNKPTIDKVENIAYKGYSSHSIYDVDNHLSLCNGGDDGVASKVFTFDAVKNASYYEVWYADYNGEKSYDKLNWYKRVETYWNGYQDNDLKMGTDILIKVRAVDSEGNKGEFSEVYEIRLIDFEQIWESKKVNSDAGICTWSDCNNRFSFYRCLLYTNKPDGGYTLVEDSGKLYDVNTYKFNKVNTVKYHKVKLLCYYEVILNGEWQEISIGDNYSYSWRIYE